MLTFWKYQGLGNDFIMFNGLEEPTSPLKKLTPDIIQSLCHRHTGIGADGIVVASRTPEKSYLMTYFNADGHEAEMCGNGLRCMVALLRDLGEDLTHPTQILTGGSAIIAQSQSDGSVRNSMPAPVFRDIQGIPKPDDPNLIHTIDFDERRFHGIIVNIGNPHAVIPESITLDDLLTWGPKIEHHPMFPGRTNVEFIEVLNTRQLKIQIWERGVGRTLACGSGATASAVAAAALGKIHTGQDIKIIMDGGTLTLNVSPDFKDIWLQGPAQIVFQGELSEEGGWHGLVS